MTFYATFWLCLLAACLIWYSTVTVYVAIRGAADIKGMLGRLDAQKKLDDDAENNV